jgi:hypothetical protein
MLIRRIGKTAKSRGVLLPEADACVYGRTGRQSLLLCQRRKKSTASHAVSRHFTAYEEQRWSQKESVSDVQEFHSPIHGWGTGKALQIWPEVEQARKCSASLHELRK